MDPSAIDPVSPVPDSVNEPAAPANRETLIAALRQNWRREQEGARTYRELAGREQDSSRSQVLLRLAEAEERHAARWERELAALGATPPVLTLTWRDRLKRWLQRGLDVDTRLRRMEADEDSDIARYEAHASNVDDAQIASMLREVRREEQAHGRLIHEMLAPIGPQSMLDVMLHRERWHKRGGGCAGSSPCWCCWPWWSGRVRSSTAPSAPRALTCCAPCSDPG